MLTGSRSGNHPVPVSTKVGTVEGKLFYSGEAVSGGMLTLTQHTLGIWVCPLSFTQHTLGVWVRPLST